MVAEILIVTVNFNSYETNAMANANIIQFLCLVKTDDVIHIIIDLFRVNIFPFFFRWLEENRYLES